MHLPRLSYDVNASFGSSKPSGPPPHRILIVGASYGGISALVNLLDLTQGKPNRPCGYALPDLKGRKAQRGVDITVLDERDGFFHCVGAPLAHTTEKHAVSMWKRFSTSIELRQPYLRFKQGSLTKIDTQTKIAEYLSHAGTRETHAYDYLILATGMKRSWPAIPKADTYSRYLKDALDLVDKLKGPTERHVVVVGGGAVGIEFCGEIKYNHPSSRVTLVHSHSTLLSNEPLPDEAKQIARKLLEEADVELVLGQRVSWKESNDKFTLTLADGTILDKADVVLDATHRGYPITAAIAPEVKDNNGFVKTTPNLAFQDMVPNASSHFAVGDIVEWSGIRRAGGAIVMGQVVASNLMASILNSEGVASGQFNLAELPEFPIVIGLAIGKMCLTYVPGVGVEYGEDKMKLVFGDDLGWAACLKHLGLTAASEGETEMRKKELGELAPKSVAVPAA